MNHGDHKNLLREGIAVPGGVWADLGSGGGAFTLALADLIGATGHIYSVDQDRRALDSQHRAMNEQFPNVKVDYIVGDFTRPLALPASGLDGVVMANSLHFHREKLPILRAVSGYLKPGGRLILVEYNVDRGNFAVPYPLSYPTWEALAAANGFVSTRLLAKRPSRFLNEIYSALSFTATIQ